MAAQENLETLLQRYNDESKADETALKQQLRNTPKDERYNLLMKMNDGKKGVHKAVEKKDLEMVKCLLEGFNEDQVHKLVSKEQSMGQTALYKAIDVSIIDMVKYLLDHMTQQQTFELLKMQYLRNTPLHKAANHEKGEMILLVLSYLSLDQQLTLLHLQNDKRDSVVDVILGWPSKWRAPSDDARILTLVQLTCTFQIERLASTQQKEELDKAEKGLAELQARFDKEKKERENLAEEMRKNNAGEK